MALFDFDDEASFARVDMWILGAPTYLSHDARTRSGPSAHPPAQHYGNVIQRGRQPPNTGLNSFAQPRKSGSDGKLWPLCEYIMCSVCLVLCILLECEGTMVFWVWENIKFSFCIGNMINCFKIVFWLSWEAVISRKIQRISPLSCTSRQQVAKVHSMRSLGYS